MWSSRGACAILVCALAVHIQAQAQPYPAKPIRLLIPTAAGGGPDTIGRAIGQSLSESFGQTVVVDNRPGASGAIAMDVGKLAAPDGYTLNVFSVSQIIRPLLFRVPYDLERDFAPISQLSAQSYVLMTTLSLPVKSVPELLAHARTNPGKLNFASVGQGSQIHLMTELFRSMTRIQVVHVPYKGIAAAYPDLFAGTIHFTFAGIISAQPHIKAQRVRALAVSGPTRMKALPELPTVAEAGVPGFAVTQWYGLLAPAGTPRQTVELLNKEVRRALEQPDVAGRIAAAYPDLFAGTIHFTFAGIISAQTHVKAQRVRALAVSGPTRMKALPDLPTVAEAGVPGFAVTQWYGLLAPAGTPRQTVEFLNKEVRRALQQPDVAGRIAAEGSEAVASTPPQLAAQIKAERAKWAKVIKEAGIKGEE